MKDEKKADISVWNIKAKIIVGLGSTNILSEKELRNKYFIEETLLQSKVFF